MDSQQTEPVNKMSLWPAALIIVAALVFLGIALTVSVCVGENLAYRELRIGLISKGDVATRADAYRQTVIQISGGVVVLFGLYLTYWRTKLTDRQTKLTGDRIAAIEDGQVTERFTRAIEHLGSEKIEVRLGGIYALERIAKDSPKDHWTVMETLSAFIREKRPITDRGDLSNVEIPTSDIQAAVTVIGRRDDSQDPREAHLNFEDTCLATLKLEGATLARANLFGANLWSALLDNANLREASLTSGNFRGASLRGCNLREANLESATFDKSNAEGAELQKVKGSRASFRDANLRDADMTQAYLKESIFTNADLQDAHLPGAQFPRANLEGAYFHRAKLSDVNFTSANLREAVLDDANCQNAYFKAAKAEGIMIAGADLQGAFIRRGDFKDASLLSLNVRGAKIHGVDLSTVQALENTDFCECASLNGMDGKTVLPAEQRTEVEQNCPALLTERA